MRENIRLSLLSIKAHKMRSFLTMLGIIIGIAAIIAIVSTIKGTNDQIQKNLIGAGTNTVTVTLQQDGYDYDFSYNPIPSGIKDPDDAKREELKKIRDVEDVSFFYKRITYDDVYYGSKALSGGVVNGIDAYFLKTARYKVINGRGLFDNDFKRRIRVALVDENASRGLFQSDNPVGKIIEIKGFPYTIVGVVKPYTTFEPVIETISDYYTYQQDTSGNIFVPDTTWPVIYQYDEIHSILLSTDNTKAMTHIGKDAENILNTSSSSVSFKAKDLLEQAKQMQQLSKSTNMMLIWIAAISLLVGGIGVMNIMLVSVSERTSEIGLKKAIGARNKTILIQFLTEAVVLTCIGGLLGVISGLLLAKLISILNQIPVALSWPANIGAVLFSMAIGILFGILPARRASTLDPIEALRHE